MLSLTFQTQLEPDDLAAFYHDAQLPFQDITTNYMLSTAKYPAREQIGDIHDAQNEFGLLNTLNTSCSHNNDRSASAIGTMSFIIFMIVYRSTILVQ